VRAELLHRKVSKRDVAQPNLRLRSTDADVRPKGCDRGDGDHPHSDQARRERLYARGGGWPLRHDLRGRIKPATHSVQVVPEKRWRRRSQMLFGEKE